MFSAQIVSAMIVGLLKNVLQSKHHVKTFRLVPQHQLTELAASSSNRKWAVASSFKQEVGSLQQRQLLSQLSELEFLKAEWKSFIRSWKRRLTCGEQSNFNKELWPGQKPLPLTCWAVLFPSWAETCLNVSQLVPLC